MDILSCFDCKLFSCECLNIFLELFLWKSSPHPLLYHQDLPHEENKEEELVHAAPDAALFHLALIEISFLCGADLNANWFQINSTLKDLGNLFFFSAP